MAKQNYAKERQGFVPCTHRAFRPYSKVLGEITIAWNGLHSSMCMLFCAVMGGGFINQYLAIWANIPNDRAQRSVLLGAARDAFVHYDRRILPAVVERIEWIVGQANRIEDHRNDALHSPLVGYIRSEQPTVILAEAWKGHIRANKLANKADLLAEFRWYRDAIMALERNVWGLDHWLENTKRRFPDRLSLPARRQASARGRSRPTR